MQRHRLWNAVYVAVVSAGFGGAAIAQDAAVAPSGAEDAAVATKDLETLTVLGSRRLDRSSDTQTAVPVDVIPLDFAAEQGAQFDLAQTLQYTAPSFTSTRQTGADGADLIDGAALRGLGSDQTLLLVNGKRHHTVSLVNIYGARNRGNTGSDLNAIPVLAIERVEILRDGAAAQYGSDAIAGVINLALKRRPGCETVLGYGLYSRGDGENSLASAYCGLSLFNGGHFAVTGEWQDRGRSDRSEPRGSPRIIGDSEVENRTLYINGDMPLGDAAEFYFTAGMQSRDASSAAFARDGVDDVPSRNSAGMYPDGFVPFIDGELEDRYSIVGLRGDATAWHWDLSHTYGSNAFDYTIRNTLNASIANRDLLDGGRGISPSQFDAGGFSFVQSTTNVDISRYYDGVLNGLNVAFGAEHREEDYRIRAGERGSYADYDGPGGGNPGSQGFPGFQPSDVTDRGRDSNAAYVDLEADITDRLLVAVAGRYEDYSDFGTTTTGKLASAFRATDTLLLRGSVSTGFRAPSLQQTYFSSTITEFASGSPVDIVIAPNDSALVRLAGIAALREETSRSATLGLTWTPRPNLSMTVDAYRIDIDDRIILGGEFDETDPNIGPILTSLQVGVARFFSNAADTKTQGLDFTLTHDSDLWGGKLNTYLGVNFSKTQVIRVNTPAALAGREDTFLPERDRLFLENGAPSRKGVLSFDYALGAWSTNLKVIHFGPQTLGTFSGTANGVANQHYGARTSADLSFTYSFNEHAKLSVGGTNLFDVFASRQNPDETDNGHISESVQFGLNGTAYFTRFYYRF
ncbi:MAG: TonB-dependent receptor plug domain-containing protein [Luteimonas sp.]